ncbi:MAG: alpha/beta fold hydrolase [Planctomycetaceae bacterium]
MQPDVERVAVTVDGHEVAVDVHLRAAGGPPVVFLHGLLTSSRLARQLFEDPDGESWVAVSLPGHHPGRLAAGTRPDAVNAELFAMLIDAALARVLGSRRVVATGWSTGGFAALNLAIRRPERVAAVASLAGFASGRRVTGSIAWLAWLARTSAGAALVRGGLWAGGRMQWLHDAIVRTAAADATAARALDDATRATLWRDFRSHDPAELALALAALPALEITSRLGEIATPTWIVAGGCDPLVPSDEARRLASAIRGATLTVYDPGGHLFFHEWPGFQRDFADWRADLTDSRR